LSHVFFFCCCHCYTTLLCHLCPVYCPFEYIVSWSYTSNVLNSIHAKIVVVTLVTKRSVRQNPESLLFCCIDFCKTNPGFH
jgi:hypothetical protein